MSTDHEEQHGSFENQVEYYSNYISKKPEYELAGIYTDEGITATNTKKREGFNNMIADCEAGKIDMIITKSISRFARNTHDCLRYARHLKELGISVYFEKEAISTTDATGELLFTILSSLAQEESRNISENCNWAIQHCFKKGKAYLNTNRFMGYDTDKNGNLVINRKQAKTVRYIFDRFEEGMSYTSIGRELRDMGVKPIFNGSWQGTIILGMLSNEKYCGDLLMQKTFTIDYLTKKRVRNHGERGQYFVEANHPAIIPKDEWKAVQMEIKRRRAYIEEVGNTMVGFGPCPFTEKVLCGRCGKVYKRIVKHKGTSVYWTCTTRRRLKKCEAENIKEELIYEAFKVAWNEIWALQDEYMIKWQSQIDEGNPLERLRAKQIIEQIQKGRLEDDSPYIIRMTLERMIVHNKEHFEIRFLDGTIRDVHI